MINKLVSIITCCCFLLSSCLIQVVEGIEEAVKTINLGSRFISASNSQSLPFQFDIPASVGRITDSENFNSDTLVINIQDLHCHSEVQYNIAKILEILDKKYKLRKVFVEGGYGDIDTSWLCGINDKEVKKDVIENLVNRGRLTGSEYYSAIANRPDLLKGIEDEAVHKASIVSLGEIFDRKEYFEEKIREMDRSLEFMQAKYLSSRNSSFNRLVEDHRAGRIETEKYYKLLSKKIETINRNPGKFNGILTVSIDNYPNIKAYLESRRISKQLKRGRISRQLQAFIVILKAKLPYQIYNSILEKTDNFSKTNELYSCIANIAQDPDVKEKYQASFPDLYKFIEYMANNKNINPLKLIEEERNLVEELRICFSKDVSELEVSFLADFYASFKDYLLNTLSENDYKYFIQRLDKFRFIWNKYAFNNTLSGLEKDFNLLNEFYESNLNRNNLFLKNIDLADNLVSGTKAHINSLNKFSADNNPGLLRNLEIVVVVTGGFHTEGLKSILQDKKISYLVVTPNVTTDAVTSSAIYSELVKQQAAALLRIKSGSLSETQLFPSSVISEDRLCLNRLSPSSSGLTRRSRKYFPLSLYSHRSLPLNDFISKEPLVSQSLALALGSMGAKIIDIGKDKIIIDISGKRIEINPSKNKNFNIADALRTIKKQTTISKEVSKMALLEFEKITKTIVNLGNPLASTELIYELIKSFAKFGAPRDLFGSNGIIFNIASNEGVQKAIEKNEHITLEELNGFPEILQQIAADNAVIKEELLDNAKTPLITAIIEAISNTKISSKLVNLVKSDTGIVDKSIENTSKQLSEKLYGQRQESGSDEEILKDIDRVQYSPGNYTEVTHLFKVFWEKITKERINIDPFFRSENEYKLVLNFRLDEQLMDKLEKELKNKLPPELFNKIIRNRTSAPYVTFALFNAPDPKKHKEYKSTIINIVDENLPEWKLRPFTFYAKGIGIMQSGAIFIPMYVDNQNHRTMEYTLAKLKKVKDIGMVIHKEENGKDSSYITHATYGYITGDPKQEKMGNNLKTLSKEEKKQLIESLSELEGKFWGSYDINNITFQENRYTKNRKGDYIRAIKEYELNKNEKAGSLFGFNIWQMIGDALKLKLGIDNPLVQEVLSYSSSKAFVGIAHDLAVKAVTALGRKIEPDVDLTDEVLRQPFLSELKGKVVIEAMNGPPKRKGPAAREMKDDERKSAKDEELFDFKSVAYSKDEKGVLHVILPQEFKDKYSDKIIQATTLVVIHEYLESTGRTHEEVVKAGFGPELLNLPKDELQKIYKEFYEKAESDIKNQISSLHTKIIKNSIAAREMFYGGNVDQARELASEITNDFNRYFIIANGMDPYLTACYYNVGVMKRLAKKFNDSNELFVKDSVQILLLDSQRQSILLQKRGDYKRSFPRKYTVSANTKPKKDDSVYANAVEAVFVETGLKTDQKRFVNIETPNSQSRSRFIAYDFPAFTPEEEVLLKNAHKWIKSQYQPESGILFSWSDEKKSLCVFSVKLNFTKENVKPIADLIMNETGIPYIYPAFNEDNTALLIYELNKTEEKMLLETAGARKIVKDKALGALLNVKIDASILKDADSDEMSFRDWQLLRNDFITNPSDFALDLTSTHFGSEEAWKKIFPDMLSIDDPKAQLIAISGGKGSNTHILRKLMKSRTVTGLVIPETSVLTSYAFKRYVLGNKEIFRLINLLKNEANEEMARKYAAELRKRIKRIQLSDEFKQKIYEEFENLGQDIAIRSSANIEDLKDFSAAGLGDSFLHVTNQKEAVECVKKVWASLFNDGFVEAHLKKSISYKNAVMTVLLQKFIEPNAAGVVFTLHETQRPVYIIEAQPGVGEGVVQGNGISDRWTVGFMADAILEKKIERKNHRYIIEESGGIKEENISDNDPCISDDKILEVARLVKLIHRYYQENNLAANIDVEFVIDKNMEVIIVQTRSKSSESKEKAGSSSFFISTVDEKNIPEGTQELQLSENAPVATYGAVTAKLQVLKTNISDKEARQSQTIYANAAASVEPGVILVAHHTNNEFNGVFAKLAGVITTDGGTTSHAAQNSSPLRIPCLVGVVNAIEILSKYNGQIVTFDSDKRKIYLGAMPIKTEERSLSVWTENKPEIDAIIENEPHEIFERWELTNERRPEVYRPYAEDGHLRRRSHYYRYFELDYYYKAWDRLTDYLNKKFEKRRPWRLETQDRVFKSGLRSDRFLQNRHKSDVFHASLYQRMTQNDPKSIFNFIDGINNLTEYDLQDLFDDRINGFSRAHEVIDKIDSLNKNNVESMVDTLIDTFVWMHFGFWLNVTVNHIFAFDQLRYVNYLFRNLLKDESVKNLPNDISAAPNRTDVPKGKILKLSRQKDVEIYATIERIYRIKELANIFKDKKVDEIKQQLKENYEDIYKIIDSWSMRYKATSEHLDKLSDTNDYLADLKGRIIKCDTVSFDFVADQCVSYQETLASTEIDLNELQVRNEILYLLFRQFSRVQAANKISREQPEIPSRSFFEIIVDIGEDELNPQMKILISDINAFRNSEESKRATIQNAMHEFPRLKYIAALSHQEFLLREDGHHLIVPIQRKIARLMIDAGRRFSYVLGSPEHIFDISTDELIALFLEKNPGYISDTLKRNMILKRIEDEFSVNWKEGPYKAVEKYEKEIKEVIGILNSQFARATITRAKTNYMDEIKRINDRLSWFKDNLRLLRLSKYLNHSDTDRKHLKADVLMVCGDDSINIFEEVIELYAEGKIKKVIISVGLGRGLLPLIEAAFYENIPVKINDNEIISHLNHIKRLKRYNAEGRLSEALGKSEADIIKQIILSLAKNMKNKEGNLTPVFINDEDIIFETRAANISEFFMFSAELLQMMTQDLKPDERPLTVAYMHDPILNFRTKAIFEKIFEKKLNSGIIRGINYSQEYDIFGFDKQKIKEEMLREVFYIILYSKAELLKITYKGVQGLNAMPPDFWQAVAEIIESYPDKNHIKQILFEMTDKQQEHDINFNHSVVEIISGLNENASPLKNVLRKIFSEASEQDSEKPNAAFFGFKIWQVIGDALKLKLGIDNPLVQEVLLHFSNRASVGIAHDLAVKAVTALGRNIEPDVKLTKEVLSQPFLSDLEGKVVIEAMNSPSKRKGAVVEEIKEDEKKSAKDKDIFDSKSVTYSKDEKGILHVILSQEFKEKYSDKIIQAATLAVIHEYLESTGKTHREVVEAGFGPELLNLPKDELQNQIQHKSKIIANYLIAPILAKNKEAQVWNWHYIKSSGLTEAVRKFGAAVIDENGKVQANIYLMDKVPDDNENRDLKNTGIIVDGKPVWASTKPGALVIFAEGRDINNIAESINEMTSDKGKISGSGRIRKRFKGFLQKVNVNIDFAGFKPGIIVDHTASGRTIFYNEQGATVVTADLFMNKHEEIIETTISTKLGELLTIRNAESVALAQNIYINLDGLTNIKEFTADLEAFNKAGNGQMIVDPAVFKDLSETRIRAVAELAGKSGVRICVDLKEKSGAQSSGFREEGTADYYRKLGFSGYALTKGNETRIYDFEAMDEGVKAEIITGYINAEQLKNKIRDSNETCKILNLSDLKGLLKGGERSIIDRVAITEILKTAILSLYNPNTLSDEYVREVGYAWDREKLPLLPDNMDILIDAVKSGAIEQILLEMGISGIPHSVNTYLGKITAEVKGSEDELKLHGLQKAFLTAIVEKMLAKAKLDSVGKNDGLADQELEIVLGQKLLQQNINMTEGKGLFITPEIFTEQNNIDAAAFYSKLKIEVGTLSESDDPQAINVLIELIPQLGEPKILQKDQEKGEMLFDVNSMNEILNAA